MKYLVTFVAVFSLFSGNTTLSQDQERAATSVIELIANPKEFDRKPVSVIGYLKMGERSDLFVHQEDAEHLLTNSVGLSSTDDMRRRKEELNGKYVYVIGLFRAIPTANGGFARFITDIKSCTVWSDPEHPRGHVNRHTK